MQSYSNVVLCAPEGTHTRGELILASNAIQFSNSNVQIHITYREIDLVLVLQPTTPRRYALTGFGWNTIGIYTKDLLIYELNLHSSSHARKMCLNIEERCLNEMTLMRYPFSYKPSFTIPSDDLFSFSLEKHFEDILTKEKCQLSFVNSDFSICSSYARHVVVPSVADEDMLIASAQFRRHGRFPIISYFHANKSTLMAIASELLTTPRTAGRASAEAIESLTNLTSIDRSASTSNVLDLTRCRADEQLLSAILPVSQRGCIIDIRCLSKNKKSVEMDQFYPQWKRIHKPISDISEIYTTFCQFVRDCISPSQPPCPTAVSSKPGLLPQRNSDLHFVSATSSQITANVSSTGVSEDSSPVQANDGNLKTGKVSLKKTTKWLSIVRESLSAAVAGAAALDGQDSFAQQQLQQDQLLLVQGVPKAQKRSDQNEVMKKLSALKTQGSCVLILGKDGRDRTLLVSSLIQIILSSKVRTIDGFKNLVQRDWLNAGHSFAERCNHSALAETYPQGESPVFLLFLDCVWQIWNQYPNSFQFSEDLLILFAKHVYASEFGTFLGNSEKDRASLEISTKTVSFWCYLSSPDVLSSLFNPLYSPFSSEVESNTSSACWPCLAPQALNIWQEVYQKQILPRSIHGVSATYRRQALFDTYKRFTGAQLTAQHLQKIVNLLKQEATENGLLKSTA